VKGSEALAVYGFEGFQETEPVNVNLESMIELFKMGHSQFSPLWKSIFCKRCFEEINGAAAMDSAQFHFPTEAWIQILYELAATYHIWPVNRNKLLDIVRPLYYARVASFVRQSWEMSSQEAEALVEEQAEKFEEQKDYLIQIWDKKTREKA
jgi:hypothetical protein